MEVKPIYVHIIEESLLSTIGYEKITFEDYLKQTREKSEEIKNLEERWSNFWRKYTNGPIEMYGVKIDVNKVIDHYIRLKLLRDAFRKFRNKKYAETADVINEELEYLANIKNFNNAEEFARRAYTSFLNYGTPILYCKYSGFVSIGSEVFWKNVQNNTKTIFGKIMEKFGVKFKGLMEFITMKNQKILYFEDIEEPPHDIIKKHYYAVKELRNIDKAKELENEIIKMIDKVYHRVNEKGDYMKAFKSYEDEAIGAAEKKISFPIAIGSMIIAYVIDKYIGGLIGLFGKNIALKCVVRDKIFGVEIREDEIPDMIIKTLEPYKNIRYRIFRIPVKEEHHTSEEVTVAKLKE